VRIRRTDQIQAAGEGRVTASEQRHQRPWVRLLDTKPGRASFRTAVTFSPSRTTARRYTAHRASVELIRRDRGPFGHRVELGPRDFGIHVLRHREAGGTALHPCEHVLAADEAGVADDVRQGPALTPLNGAAVANGLEQLAGEGDVCGDERAAVGRALNPELSVEDGEPVCQPEEPAAFG
jgi:hypothetical protein